MPLDPTGRLEKRIWTQWARMTCSKQALKIHIFSCTYDIKMSRICHNPYKPL